MIRRLVLRDWRNYDDVTVTFSEGTTFVVARNGIGKSSLVEAARYAVFGTTLTPPAAVRLGRTHAEATVELELPSGRILIITRRLDAKRPTKRLPPPEPTVTLDGAPFNSADLSALIASEYGTEPAFLARVTMPAPTLELESPDSMGLEDHLGRFYGIHNLRAAAIDISMRTRTLTKRIEGVRNANATSAKQLDTLRAAVALAQERVTLASSEYETARTRLDEEQRRQFAREQVAAWQEQEAQRAAQFVELAAALTFTTGEPATADDDLADNIDRAVEATRKLVAAIDVRVGVLETTVNTLRTNLERLTSAHEGNDDCPVCRRALDETTAANAAQATSDDLAAIAAELAELQDRRAAHDSSLTALERLQRHARTIPQSAPYPAGVAPPDAPNQPDDVARDEGDNLAVLEGLQRSSMDALVTTRADLQSAQRAAEAAQNADAAMRELADLYAQLAKLTVAQKATEETLNDILNDAVRPLASAVNERWTKLFPDRGRLETAADGTVTRSVAGHRLPFSSFSAGEGAGLNLLIRLVVAHMATKADFCWFDETLEHMDPDTRRHVASMLARAGSGEGPMRQIVVTTYEETLARQLAVRDPTNVHITDVRQRPSEAESA